MCGSSPDPDVVAYVVYRAKADGALERIGSVRAPATTFTDRDLASGVYRYAVTAQFFQTTNVNAAQRLILDAPAFLGSRYRLDADLAYYAAKFSPWYGVGNEPDYQPALHATPLESLTVTLYLARATGPATFHEDGLTTTYRATGMAAASCHVSRTVCRRAERELVTLGREEAVRPEALRYLNRLSDLLFVVARMLARASGHGEVLWQHERRKRPA